jgi:sugar/nucleoside kinase (ribokinase family)
MTADTPFDAPTFDAAVFGLIVADLVTAPIDLANPPKPGGLVRVETLTLATGGNVCNTGIAMRKLGGRVAACGLVGDDPLGSAMLASLAAAGLDTAGVRRDGRAQTSATVVAVAPDGERCFFHAPGVAPLLDADAFRGCFDTFAASRFVQVGYFGLLENLTDDLPSLIDEFRRTRSPRVRFALDTVHPPAAAERLWPILPHLDVFCPSRSEAIALADTREPGEMIDRFRAAMPADALVGIKLDAEGCLLDDGRSRVFVPSYRVKVIDTTGAGDTWFGGLLTGLRLGLPLEQAGRLANRAAADCCTALGASTGVRDLADTLARL